jgi:hypothetical protein
MRSRGQLIIASCLLVVSAFAGAPAAAAQPQNPANICRGTEETLPYPYSMQIFIDPPPQGGEAVPVGPPVLVERFGDCVGYLGQYWTVWVAVISVPA